MGMEEKKTGFGLEKKIVILLFVLMTLMSIAVLTISGLALRNNYYKLYSEKAQDVVRMISHDIDGDWLEKFSETYEKDETYEEVLTYMNNIKKNFGGIQYLYVLKPGETGFTYLIEAYTDKDNMEYVASPGDTYEYVESDYEGIVPDIKAARASDRVIVGSDVGFGTTISAWAPVFNSNNELVAMVDADYILENINPDIREHMNKIMLFEILSILFIVFLMLIMIRKVVVEPITHITEIVHSYEHGELVQDMSRFKGNDEVSWLAFAFRDMTVRIDKYIKDLTKVTAEKERIGAELNVATQIQADMLPRIFPAFPERKEFDLYATMNPAKEVGGDFYDFFMIDDDHLGLVMADVSGKGVPAALFMVIAKTMIKNGALTGNYNGPGEILAEANNQLCEGNDAELFVTVWLGILTISTGHIVFASGGHEYPAFCRVDGGFRLEKDKHGAPLATMEGLKFRETETDLRPGETLYLYTDGVTEATNANNELFGENRMIEALEKYKDDNMHDLLLNVRKEIDTFVGEAPQFDDITMLGIHYFGKVG
ncbi:MAG: PP2C family protein-serine/threonine phosphatase [Lachnospiraceae bacterium]|nr:PP2C family protein-serine/threonine phosphatase [Lachnospiraceae bacterium]